MIMSLHAITPAHCLPLDKIKDTISKAYFPQDSVSVTDSGLV